MFEALSFAIALIGLLVAIVGLVLQIRDSRKREARTQSIDIDASQTLNLVSVESTVRNITEIRSEKPDPSKSSTDGDWIPVAAVGGAALALGLLYLAAPSLVVAILGVIVGVAAVITFGLTRRLHRRGVFLDASWKTVFRLALIPYVLLVAAVALFATVPFADNADAYEDAFSHGGLSGLLDKEGADGFRFALDRGLALFAIACTLLLMGLVLTALHLGAALNDRSESPALRGGLLKMIGGFGEHWKRSMIFAILLAVLSCVCAAGVLLTVGPPEVELPAPEDRPAALIRQYDGGESHAYAHFGRVNAASRHEDAALLPREKSGASRPA